MAPHGEPVAGEGADKAPVTAQYKEKLHNLKESPEPVDSEVITKKGMQ